LLTGFEVSAGLLSNVVVFFDYLVRGSLTVVLTSFTTTNPIPTGGWVAVHFPPEYTPAVELEKVQAFINGVGPLTQGQGLRLTVDENCGRLPDSEPAQCEANTEGTCKFSSCYSWRGATDCIGGKCMCQPGHCANEGKCVERVCAVVEAQLTDVMAAVNAGDQVEVKLTGIRNPDLELASPTQFLAVRTYGADGRLVDRDTPVGLPVIQAPDLQPMPWDGPWLYAKQSHMLALIIPLLLLQMLIFRIMSRWKSVKVVMHRYSPCLTRAVSKILPMDPEIDVHHMEQEVKPRFNTAGIFDDDGVLIEERVGGLLPPKAPTEVRAVISGPKKLTVYFQPVLNDDARLNDRFPVNWYRVTATPDVKRVKHKNTKALAHGGRRNSLVKMPSMRVLSDAVVIGMGRSSPIVLDGLMPGMIYTITATAGSPAQYGKDEDLMRSADSEADMLIGESVKRMMGSFRDNLHSFSSFIGSFKSLRSSKELGKGAKTVPNLKKKQEAQKKTKNAPGILRHKTVEEAADEAAGSFRIVKAHPTRVIAGGEIEMVERGGKILRVNPSENMSTPSPALARRQKHLTRKLSMNSQSQTQLLTAGPKPIGYRVWSKKSAPSAPVAAAVPPTVPRQVWVSTIGQCGKINFQVPETDGGIPVNYYEVVAHPCGADGYAIEDELNEFAKHNRKRTTVRGDKTLGEIPDLVWGVAYRFTVLACNGVGEGPSSDFTDVLMVTAPPSAPMSVWAEPDIDSAVVSWERPKVTGGLPIDQYEVLVWELPTEVMVARYGSVIGADGLRINPGTRYCSFLHIFSLMLISTNQPTDQPTQEVPQVVKVAWKIGWQIDQFPANVAFTLTTCV
jgi:hypothetical protein